MKTTLTLSAILLATAAHAQSYGPYTGHNGIDYYAPTIQNALNSQAVITIHGGALVSGSKTQWNIVDFAQSFAAAGFAAFSIDYRLLNDTTFWPAPIQDTQTAIRYVRSLGYKTVIVAGKSSGGYLALFSGALGTQVMTDADADPMNEAALYPGYSSRPDVVIDVSGPKDQGMYQQDVGDSSGSPQMLVGLPDAPSSYAVISPISYLTPLMPPTISFEGTLDKHIFVDQANEWHARALALGTVHQLVTGKFNHVFSGMTDDGASCVEEAIRFAKWKRLVIDNSDCIAGN